MQHSLQTIKFMLYCSKKGGADMLKRILCFLLTILIVAPLCACSDEPNEEQIASDMEGILTELFGAVQAQDKEAFKAFFADHVIELDNFEDGCGYVFNTYQGDLIDISFYSAGHEGTEFTQEERICYAYMSFIVTTSKTEYMVCVEFYTKCDSKYSDDSYKIRQLSVFPKQDDGSFIPIENDGNFSKDWISFGQRHGIYYPGWQVPEGD